MSLTGIWHLSIATPMGQQEAELELVQHGPDQISGVSRSGPADEDAQPMIDPQLTGNQLTWKSMFTRPVKVTATMKLTFDGDSVTGTAKAGMFPALKIVGRRAP
jgi:putative sterol carrier protein